MRIGGGEEGTVIMSPAGGGVSAFASLSEGFFQRLARVPVELLAAVKCVVLELRGLRCPLPSTWGRHPGQLMFGIIDPSFFR